jgi:hypothetical protein
MAYRIISNGPNIQTSVAEIVVDTLADLDSVPTTFGVGSDCIVLENSSVYMLGSDKVWHEL